MFARVNLILAAACFAVAICIGGASVLANGSGSDCVEIMGQCTNQGCSGQLPNCGHDNQGNCHCEA